MNGNIDITLSFASGGTNFGDGVRTGDFSAVSNTNPYNFSIPSGLINNSNVGLNTALGASMGAGVGIPMYSLWSPSINPELYALQTVLPNSQITFQLGTLAASSQPLPPAKISSFDGSPCVEFDYGRPITISGVGPFTAIVSGYDYYGQKTVYRGDSDTTDDPIYPQKVTTCRGIKYLTNVQVINGAEVSTQVTLGVEAMIELPYNDLGRQSNLLLWTQSNGYQPTAMQSISIGVSGSKMSFFAGETGGAWDNFGYSYIPASWDLTAAPITLTSGNPRPIINIEGNNRSTRDSDPASYITFNEASNEHPVMNVFIQNVFGLNNLPSYKNPSYDFSLPEIYANNYQTVFGRPNYTDSNWRGWAG